jgi:hypothetical protein
MYQNVFFTAATVIALLQIMGCGEGKSTVATPAPAPAPVAASSDPTKIGSNGLPVDPIASFKAFLKDEFKRIEKASPKSILSDNHSINVETTNSLVTPLLGTCGVQISFVMSTPDEEVTWQAKFDTNYGWQDGNWVCTTGTATVLAGQVVRQASNTQTVVDTLVERRQRFTYNGFDELISKLNNGF